jgi:hypothetical protein
MLRLLALMALLKFLMFSHPDAERDLDAVAVEVVYKTARHVEHGALLTDLEKSLAEVQLASLAGAVLLIRF